MLRITQYIRDTLERKATTAPDGVILIWNLTNVCNLYCKHCYSSANQNKTGELSEEEIYQIIQKLKDVGVRFVILSGGEPLMREDIFRIAKKLKEQGMNTYLSTNGILIDEKNLDEIKNCFDYVGISIDGEPEIHDSFRGKKGSFDRSMHSIRLLRENGIRVGLRFTITPLTKKSIPFIFKLVEEEKIPKLYISHLVYSGRGRKLSDVEKKEYKDIMEFIINKAFEYVENSGETDIVTGNNEADAVTLYEEFRKRYPHLADSLYERLLIWGGNQAGVRLMNIDHRGNVKPDPFFEHTLGNIRELELKDIWKSNSHITQPGNSESFDLLSFLREKPRRIKGKCSVCRYIDICNGSSRARAWAVFKDYTQEDPACYL